YTGDNTAAEIAVAASGRFVYASNRGHNSVATFAVNASNGMLSPLAWESTQGATPRYFGVDPTGAELYAANQGSDTVVRFRVNQTTGMITPAGETIKVGAPCTIAFK